MTKKDILEMARETLNFSDNLLDVIGDIIITAKQPNGLYTIFSPYHYYSDSGIHFDKLYCVCYNVEKILYTERESTSLLLMKVKTGENIGYWTMLYPKSFSAFLTEERCQSRFKSLPKILFQEKTTAKFLDGFEYLDSNIFVQIDGINYLIGIIDHNVYSDEAGIVAKRIDEEIRPFPSSNELKLILKNGDESICSVNHLLENKLVTSFGPAFSIEEMGRAFYPVINDCYSAHIAKDMHGNMTGVYIAGSKSSKSKYSYKIILTKPAEMMKFSRRIILKEGLNNSPYPDEAVDLWQISYCDGEKEIFIQIIGDNNQYMQFKLTCTDWNF